MIGDPRKTQEEICAGLEKARFVGRLIKPSDAEYENARRVFFGWVDRRPACIARPADETDVVRVVRLARDNGVELAVRSGGHSVAGHGSCEGGIILDLSDMRKLDLDVAQRTAWAETGLTAGQYTAAAAEHGLATPFGDTASVGIGGITLGGGVGYLSRKHGMTIDNLLAAEVVTADGELVLTDATSHPDLFWAIRGGGGNFGVVTRFKFRLHEVDQIVGGVLMLPATPDVIESLVGAAEAAPEELSMISNIAPAPPLPFVPQEHHGRLVIMVLMVYAGEIGMGQQAVAPFRRLARPIVDMVRPMRYKEMFAMEGPRPIAASAHSMYLDFIDGAAAVSIVEHLQVSKGAIAVAQLRVLGGAAGRVPANATAYAHRQRKIMVNLAAYYERPDDAVVHGPWITKFAASLRRGDTDAYVNFLADEGATRVRDAYPPATWKRLVSVKQRYDPSNLFRLNQNITPDD